MESGCIAKIKKRRVVESDDEDDASQDTSKDVRPLEEFSENEESMGTEDSIDRFLPKTEGTQKEKEEVIYVPKNGSLTPDPDSITIDFADKLDLIEVDDKQFEEMVKHFRLRENHIKMKVYPTRDSATQDNSEGLPMMAHDKSSSTKKGAKTYTLCSYYWLANKIKKVMAGGGVSSYYEVLVPGLPSQIFMDLEYDYANNPEKDPDDVEKLFNKDLYEFLVQTIGRLEPDLFEEPYGIEFLNLYSKQSGRNSRHLHIHTKGWAFKNHYHVGAFVRNFALWSVKKYGTRDPDKHPYMFWKFPREEKKPYDDTSDRQNILFYADLLVFTFHRCFRTAYSTKDGGKNGKTPFMSNNAWKQVTISRNGFNVYPTPSRELILKCMAQRIDLSDWKPTKEFPFIILTCEDPDGSEPSSTNDGTFLMRNDGLATRTKRKFEKKGNGNHPLVDAAMRMISEHLHNAASVSFLSHDEDIKIITLQTDSHLCAIQKKLKGKDRHQSNHVYYTVDYGNKMKYRQKCTDDDCIQSKIDIKYDMKNDWIVTFTDLKSHTSEHFTTLEITNSMREMVKLINELRKRSKEKNRMMGTKATKK